MVCLLFFFLFVFVFVTFRLKHAKKVFIPIHIYCFTVRNSFRFKRLSLYHFIHAIEKERREKKSIFEDEEKKKDYFCSNMFVFRFISSHVLVLLLLLFFSIFLLLFSSFHLWNISSFFYFQSTITYSSHLSF